MQITATLINLYHVCKREMWLHARDIRMEHTSDIVSDGKLLHETSYRDRNRKFNELDIHASFEDLTLSGKIDFYDTREKTIHETKRSNKVEQAHQWQAKYYLWLLLLNGIEGASAILEYPKLRKTDRVVLTKTDITYLARAVHDIAKLKQQEECPPGINTRLCKNCSYYDLCYVGA